MTDGRREVMMQYIWRDSQLHQAWAAAASASMLHFFRRWLTDDFLICPARVGFGYR